MKKLMLGIVFLILCQTVGFAAGNDGLLTASYNPTDASVTVKLSVTDAQLTPVSLVIYPYLEDDTDIGIGTEYFALLESDTDRFGALEENFEFTDDMKGGKYTVSATVGSTILYDDFYYVKRTEAEAAIEEMKKGKSLSQTLAAYHDALGIELEKYLSKSAQIDRNYNKFLKSGALTFESFYAAYMSAEIAAFCNDAAQKDVLKRYLQKYTKALGIDYSLYEALSESLKEDVLIKLCQTDYPTGFFAAEYHQAIVFSGLDQAKDGVWSVYENLLMNVYNDILNLDFTDYSKLKNKELVIKKLMSSSFSTFDALKDIFYSEVEKQLDGAGNSSNSSGGGGSGSVTSFVDFSGEPTTVVQSPIFIDVDFGHWCYREIRFMKDNHILEGDGSGNFYPDTPMTRAEFCKITAMAFQITEGGAAAGFDDISEKDWFEQYVRVLSSNHLIMGGEDNRFLPDEKITRQDMAVIVSRIIRFKNLDLAQADMDKTFVDADQISDYAAEAMLQLIQYGIVVGNDQGQLLPHYFLTKAECAKVVYNIIEREELLQ